MPSITMSVHGNAFCSEQMINLVGSDSTGGLIYGGFVTDWGLAPGWGRTFFQSGWYHLPRPYVTRSTYGREDYSCLPGQRDSAGLRFHVRVGVGVSTHFNVSEGGSVWFKSASLTVVDAP